MSARYYTVWQCQGCSSAGTREEISILDVCPKCGVYDWKKRTATLIPAVCAPRKWWQWSSKELQPARWELKP